jgi:hypothetical protein
VYTLLKELNINLTQLQATKLLAGIISNTHNLKINTDKKTLDIVQTLIHALNADFAWANKTSNKSLSELQFEWQKQVFEKATKIGNFAYSIVENDEIDSSILGGLNNEDKVPTHKIAGVDVALTLTKLSKTVHGFLYINSPKYSGLTLTNEYARVGDSKFVYFWTKENPNRIIKDFQNKIGITVPETQIIEKATIKNEIKAILDKKEEPVAEEVEEIIETEKTVESEPKTELELITNENLSEETTVETEEISEPIVKEDVSELPTINVNRLSEIEVIPVENEIIEATIVEAELINDTKPQALVNETPKTDGSQKYDPLPQAF